MLWNRFYISIIVFSFILLSQVFGCSPDQPPTIEKNIWGSLVIQWAGVSDNGEGDEDCTIRIPFPFSILWGDRTNPCHGPEGSLHVLVYEADYGCPGPQKKYSGYLSHLYLNGPTYAGMDKNGSKKWEWLDGDEKAFNDLEIFKWRKWNDAVFVFVYESDPSDIMGISFGDAVGREHDPLLCAKIYREKNCTPANDNTILSRNEACTNFLVQSNLKASQDVINKFKRIHTPEWLRKSPIKESWETSFPKMFIRFRTVAEPGSFDYRECYFPYMLTIRILQNRSFPRRGLLHPARCNTYTCP